MAIANIHASGFAVGAGSCKLARSAVHTHNPTQSVRSPADRYMPLVTSNELEDYRKYSGPPPDF